jgi:hypothetical protein
MSQTAKLFETTEFADEHGTLRLEHWPEGIVLWAGGEIAWKSWSKEIKVKLVVDCSGAIADLQKVIQATKAAG